MKLHILLILGLTAGIAGCTAKESAAPREAVEEEAAPTQIETWRTSGFMRHMHDHAEYLDELNFALADGNLDKALTSAYWLSLHETVGDLPEDLQPYLVRMREAAHAVEAADDLETARAEAQQIAAECQACHAAAGVIAQGGPAAGETPNIVLLMGDDHGWDETAYNGHPHLYTPVLDEMAATGLRLDRFYSGHPTCSPTRGSFLTGRHPNRYATFAPNWSIRPQEITIGHLMKQAGYQTGHFGKWHVGPVKKASPTSPGGMGFDEWLSHDNFFELNPVLARNGGEPEKYPGESSEILVDEAIRFIEDAHRKMQPFMALVWFGSPHEPYAGLPEDLALYDGIPEHYADKEVVLTSLETGQPASRNQRDVLRERYAEITAMDRAIGKLRDYLKKTGLRENTIVFYCGDNGVPASGDGVTNPFRAQKGTVYEGGIRVPGLIEWPAGIPEPRGSGVNTVTSDLLPTLAELTGQSLPDRPMDGISLVPLLEGDMDERPSPIFFWQYDVEAEMAAGLEPYIEPKLQDGTTPLVKMLEGKFTRSFVNFHHPDISESDYAGPRVMLDNQYKLVVDGEENSGIELFDIRKDPYETTNLAGDLPVVAKALESRLSEWQQSVLESLTGADY